MFHIVDDWYIVPDEYQWMIARLKGFGTIMKGTKKYPKWVDQKYFSTPEAALESFTRDYARENARKAGEGELMDMVSILSSSYEHVSSLVKTAFSQIREERR